MNRKQKKLLLKTIRMYNKLNDLFRNSGDESIKIARDNIEKAICYIEDAQCFN